MEETAMNVEVIWRATKLNVELNTRSTFEDLGKKLLQLTNVKPDTLKLLVPQINGRGSRLLSPFSVDNSGLGIQETGIIMGKPIRMMGVFDDEINEVSQNNMSPNLRIADFEEEDKRLKQLASYKARVALILPRGSYIFCDFRTLDLPGIKLNPPSSKALRMMHILACDPGIIAVMNKHQWRVEIMTEMAPIGYVGITPKCILGFNKNHGEEISLRLRTDDLKGFRKYESIKKTLLHELAHMVFSEHDTKFLALEKQLNEEAASLDWTKSRSQTLNGHKASNRYEDEVGHLLEDATDAGHKLGGGSNFFATARASSIAAAFDRYASSSMSSLLRDEAQNESALTDAVNGSLNNAYGVERLKYTQDENDSKPVLDNSLIIFEDGDKDPDGCMKSYAILETNDSAITPRKNIEYIKIESDDNKDKVDLQQSRTHVESDLTSSIDLGLVKPKPESDCHMSDSDNMELQRIEEPVAAIIARIQGSIKFLKSELATHSSALVLQTLSKIIRNIIEHPDELKFRRIRKANPQFQRNVANYKEAMEVLKTVGFSEDVELDEFGGAETYLVLKRNDPGLLWLAKSSLEPFNSG